MSIKEPNRKIDPAAIKKFESFIGHEIPADYRAFLLAFNGGEPEDHTFDIPQIENRSSVREFYGLVGDSYGDLRKAFSRMKERVPAGVIPIGGDECGNLICLSLRPDTFGQVYFWDHELEADEDEPATFSNLFLVGDSFDDFFARLEKYEASKNKLNPDDVISKWISPEFLKVMKAQGLIKDDPT